MPLTIINCYFLPFLVFFLAEIAFPKSLTACLLGIACMSISSLILYFQSLEKHPAPVLATQAPKAAPVKTIRHVASDGLDFAKTALKAAPQQSAPNYKAIIEEQSQALISQKNLFTEELEKRESKLHQLQETVLRLEQSLEAKIEESHRQKKELDDLKFEMYTLLRIESYVGTKNESEKLVTASF